MNEEEDFQKQILGALADLKKDMDDLRSLEPRVKKLEECVSTIFGSLWEHVKAKGDQCGRVAESPDGVKYCTAWELKAVPLGFEDRYVFVGGRYHAKPGYATCFSCFSFEKKRRRG